MRSVRIIALVFFLVIFFAPQAFAAIHISEMYPVPELGKFEWVEITNTSHAPVDIKEYILRDKTLHTLFLPHVILEAGQFIIATSSGVLNNSGDTVELVLQGNTLESITYPSGITSEQSYSLCGDEWSITDILSPGFDNPSCLVEEAIPSITATPTIYTIIPTPSSRAPSRVPSMAYMVPTGLKMNTPSATEYTSTRTIQSFTQKHIPLTSSLEPTPTKSLSKQTLQPEKDKEVEKFILKDRAKSYAYILIAIIFSLLAGLICITVYMTLNKKEKGTYNDTYDT